MGAHGRTGSSWHGMGQLVLATLRQAASDALPAAM